MSRRIGRNDPCPCGSGKKYKNCCLKKENALKNGRLIDVGEYILQMNQSDSFEILSD